MVSRAPLRLSTGLGVRQPFLATCHIQGRSQKFVSEGDETGRLGQKSPSGVQGQSPGGGLGAKPPKAVDIYANNHRNNVLTNNPYFFSMGISGGGMSPLLPPSLRPWSHTLHSICYVNFDSSMWLQ